MSEGSGLDLDTVRLLHDEIAEQSAIGGMLMWDKAVWDVMDALQPSDFYQPKHELIARAIGSLAHRNLPVDAISVGDELRTKGLLDRAGGAAYLHELATVTPSAMNAGYYAQIIKNLAVKRRLLLAGISIAQMGQASEGDPLELVEAARHEIDQVTNAARVEVKPIGDSMDDVITGLAEDPRYVETPWVDLNSFIGGLRPGTLVVIGARPGSGKTILGLQLAVTMAQHGVVAFSSLEMEEGDLQKRLLAQFGNIHMTNLMNSTLSQKDWESVATVRGQLAAAPIYIDDRPFQTMTQIKAFARSASRKGKLSCLVVDYLQLMTTNDKGKPRHEVVAEFSRELKMLAKSLGIPVVALSQLNRSPEQRVSKLPSLADLRESGAIEQDADVVLLLSRDEKSVRRGHLLDVIVAKNRAGRTGKLELLWEGQYARVRSVASDTWSPTSAIPDERLS